MASTLNSTTLASAASPSDDTLNLASVSNISVGYNLVVGRTAYEVTEISGTRVSVVKGVLGTRPEKYPSGAKVWIAQQYDLALSRKVGVGDPANEVVLPRIVVGPAGLVVQNLVGTAEQGYVWVTVVDEPKEALRKPIYRYTEPGAISIETGIHELGGDGADAMTLGTPTAADNGKELDIVSITAQAFTVTMTTADVGQGAGSDVVTFGGAIGESVTVRVVNAKWHIVSLRTATAA